MLERDALLAESIIVLVGHLDAKDPWRRDALCREYGTAVFFPARGVSADPARDVCSRCAVAVECAAYAAALPVQEGRLGVWAGSSGRDRRRHVVRVATAGARVRCDDCGGVLPVGRSGRCCGCEPTPPDLERVESGAGGVPVGLKLAQAVGT